MFPMPMEQRPQPTHGAPAPPPAPATTLGLPQPALAAPMAPPSPEGCVALAPVLPFLLQAHQQNLARLQQQLLLQLQQHFLAEEALRRAAAQQAGPQDLLTGPATQPAENNSVWQLARDVDGCRLIQDEFENAASDRDRVVLAAQLKGRVWQAMRHRHANHVLQKCIMTMRPDDVQFVVDEVGARGAPSVCRAARHAYGCRILQRLLEHCRSDQLCAIIDALILEAVPLSKHVYGNFVMQHLLEYGTQGQKLRILRELQRCAQELGRDIHSGAVLAQALAHGPPAERTSLARSLIFQEGVLASMARTRHGSAAAKLVLQSLEGAELREAQRQLSEEVHSLSARRYGRAVVACLPRSEHSRRSGRDGGA